MPNKLYGAAEVLTAANLNAYSNNSYFAQLRQTTLQAIANATFTSITFGAEDFDTDSGHDNVTNNSRYVCQTAGKYLAFGGVAYAADAGAAGARWARLAKNGTSIAGSGVRLGASNLIMSVPTKLVIVDLAVSDYLELQGHQSSGGSLNTDVATSENQSTLTVIRLSS